MKTKKIITTIVTVLAAGMVVLSGIMKLSGSEQIVTTMNKVGVGPYIHTLAFMEIAFAVLFIIPATMRIGFVLLSCYFAGAIATELSHGGPLMNAALPLTLIWISAFLRDRSIFLPATKPVPTIQ
jgi:uncharacterized membrane protein YphA (DoxX/SURF4 family)